MGGLLNFSFLNIVYFGNTIRQYLIFLLIIVLAIVIAKIIYYLLHYPLRRFTERTKTLIDEQVLEIIKWPIIFFVVIGGANFAFDFLSFSSYIREYIDGVVLTLIVLNIIWLVLRFFDLVIALYFYPLIKASRSKLDDQLVPLIQRFVKIILVVLGLFFILENLGVDTKALLTGLGIGGLAVALAAKDTLANLFGSLAVITDKPFKIGDIIKFREYEGVVKEIGMRSTKIKTFDTTEISVPNSLVANEVIENISKRQAVKKQLFLLFDYRTKWKKLEIAKKIVDNILLNQKGILDEYHSALINFSFDAIEMKIVYWVKYDGDYKKYLDSRHELHSQIKKGLEKEKIKLAHR